MDLSRYSGFGALATSSPNDDLHPEVSVCSEGFPALYLMKDFKLLESAGDRMEARLVLVHLHAGSGTGACVSRVHIGCIAAAARSLPRVPFPMKRLPMRTNSVRV